MPFLLLIMAREVSSQLVSMARVFIVYLSDKGSKKYKFFVKKIQSFFLYLIKVIFSFFFLAFLEKIDIIGYLISKNKNLSNATNTIIKIPLLSNQTIQGQRTLSGALGKTDKKSRFS